MILSALPLSPIMLTDIAKSSLEFLKLAPRYLVAVAIVAGSLLFLPVSWLEQLGLQDFANVHRQWLGFAFLVSATLWAIAIALTVWQAFSEKLFRRSVRQHVVRRLSSLTEDEKQILRYYIAKNTRANMLKVDDGVVQGLVADSIIYRSASVGHMLEGFAHNITDFAWDQLHANPDLLVGTTNFYRTDKRERGW
ncbi:superinfection exclusion B family protein [Achromobacter animicus]|uniref:superinfection exclusion B family protein n=1 Tax=Achromobacter animicus TaxID=1389935 RepID=UPI00244B162B|nr:superinfection exclusion B family protein [Achromobacter animicus]MDH0682935.1 superinfection exclusion B family protein [Achromobacter animicus]